MKHLAFAALALLPLAAMPAVAQNAVSDKLALACHVVLRDLNRSPADVTHMAGGTMVQINFKSGAEGGEPNGILCGFADDGADIPTLTSLVSDTNRGTESPLYLEGGQRAIDQYFTELASFGSVMAEVTVSPVAGASAEPAAEVGEDPESVVEPEEDGADDESAESEIISEETDQLFWCSHAMATIAGLIAADAEAGGKMQPVIDQYAGFSAELRTRAIQSLDDEGLDTSDLSELDATYEEEMQAQLVEASDEPIFTQQDCEALVQPFTPAEPLP